MEKGFDDSTRLLAMPMMVTPRVLLVDDDELLLEYLKPLVAAAGFEVVTATDGASALASLQQDFVPIVILDRNMPGMDGLALCQAIRQQNWPGYIYLILLTAWDAEEDVLLGLDAGADDYLSKRTSSAQLIARLRTATRVLTLEHSLKTALDERRRMAMTDALTGAYNRRYFMRHFGGELKRVHRFGGELSLLVIDIDHFKQVNDQHGHAAGDAVLQSFVQCMRTNLPRDYDWCARIGGEEFAVVLPQNDLAGAGVVAEKLRKAVESTPMSVGSQALPVTVSIGVSGLQAMASRKTATAEDLLGSADRLLYKSKQAGRNRITVAEPVNPL